jgi:hypothetical protein
VRRSHRYNAHLVHALPHARVGVHFVTHILAAFYDAFTVVERKLPRAA